jgi:hypothetical protein
MPLTAWEQRTECASMLIYHPCAAAQGKGRAAPNSDSGVPDVAGLGVGHLACANGYTRPTPGRSVQTPNGRFLCRPMPRWIALGGNFPRSFEIFLALSSQNELRAAWLRPRTRKGGKLSKLWSCSTSSHDPTLDSNPERGAAHGPD